jgi:NADPH:quinone reductase-like Zn-dependent oxidoreductase
MKAVRIHSFGGPEVLVYEDVPRPEPAAEDVLIRVCAAGVNPVDWKVREGFGRNFLKFTLPLILGWDASGVVEGVGANVRRLKIGDEVYSRPDINRDGTYAEYVVVREAEVALKPKSLDHEHAAAVPLAALTAWQALFEDANLTSAQTVLIHGAAGGVGNYAAQLAGWKGARVVGTASQRNQDFLRELGCTKTIDYNTTRFEDVVQGADVVLDTVGGETQDRSWKVLRKGGILVSVVPGNPSAETAAAHGVRCSHTVVRPNASQLEQIATLIDSGKLKVHLEKVFELRQAREAQEINTLGHTRGKIVLHVSDAAG